MGPSITGKGLGGSSLINAAHGHGADDESFEIVAFDGRVETLARHSLSASCRQR
jgi:hypothetical protein